MTQAYGAAGVAHSPDKSSRLHGNRSHGLCSPFTVQPGHGGLVGQRELPTSILCGWNVTFNFTQK